MGKTVVLYSKQRQSSFLRNTLFTDSLKTLRVGEKTYDEVVKSFSCLRGSQWLYADKPCPVSETEMLHQARELIQNQSDFLQHDAKVLIYDMTFYPIAYDWVEHLFEKALQTDVPLLVYAQSKGLRHLIVACMTYQQLSNENFLSEVVEPAAVNVEHTQFADLTHTGTVLRLFSSGFSLRYFNSLQLSRNVFFLKKSQNIDKTVAEHTFFSSLPAQVRPYFPQVGELRNEQTIAGYEIEIIPTLDVAKLLLNGVFNDAERASSLVNLIGQYLDACPRQTVSRPEYQDMMHQLFVQKIKDRQQATLKLPCIVQLNDVCRLNGFESFVAFSQCYIQRIEQDITCCQENELVFSHGDLFFSNILFDPVRHYIKLIDPKGASQTDKIPSLMPAWYDLAKLSHSFLGQYDLIVYNLIDVVMQENMRLGLRSTVSQGLIHLRECFLQFLSQRNISLKQLRLYEGTLFLSMLPLHAENPLRMQKQLIRAMELFRFATESLEAPKEGQQL